MVRIGKRSGVWFEFIDSIGLAGSPEKRKTRLAAGCLACGHGLRAVTFFTVGS